jgi:hypothetical protein
MAEAAHRCMGFIHPSVQPAPAEVDALTAALRTHRDQAMVAAMVLGGLRRCEVLGLRLEDLYAAERRVYRYAAVPARSAFPRSYPGLRGAARTGGHPPCPRAGRDTGQVRS